MPRPAYRTSSLRKIHVRTPGGRTTIHYEKRKPGPARCAICGKPLGGVPRLRPVELRRLPRTAKRPERMYGGVICPSCLAKLLKRQARSLVAAQLAESLRARQAAG